MDGANKRVLHRNLLLPRDPLPFETPSSLKKREDRTCQPTSAAPTNHVREDGESSDEKYTVSTLHAPSIGQRLHRDQEDDDKGTEAYPTVQCDTDSGDNTLPSTVIPQHMAAAPVRSDPEGPALPVAQLDRNWQCPEAEPLRDPTETVNAPPKNPASASGETQGDSLWPRRERDDHHFLLLTVRLEYLNIKAFIQ